MNIDEEITTINDKIAKLSEFLGGVCVILDNTEKKLLIDHHEIVDLYTETISRKVMVGE